MSSRLWPVDLRATLPDGEPLLLRRLRRGDRDEFLRLRERNAAWLRPWDPTNPDGSPRVVSYPRLLREQREQARAGRSLPFAVEIAGVLAGQVNVGNVERGAFRSCTMGYWVGREFAGRGAVTLAVAVLGDYMFRAGGMHRIEVNVRPENEPSLAVVRKLGLRPEGLRPRYLHIDGDWRDHLSFAVTTEELGPEGLVGRLSRPPQ